ncbi:Heterocyst differentiation ATP-binding protein HepA [Pigmentiphaga humi]|uniref:Heterocyst differentiation ATP-binding protein HepA n=1 Tax=Pigmentiphaga humi TaxID=2478468 RepID=A0A3P4B4B0_9BURK|nr:ABC transporter ATP-binding protein [Pigmentiphaga humi]VCU71113.1 Heterocyst differentiation ATP-binding protein HepA [Pigmentiphaga humi]
MSRQPPRSVQTTLALVLRLWRWMSPRHRRRISQLLLLALIVSATEVLTIGSVVPVLVMLVDPASLSQWGKVIAWAPALAAMEPGRVLQAGVLTLAMAALATGILRVCLVSRLQHAAQAVGHDLALACLDHALHLPFASHTERHSSSIISILSYKITMVASQVVVPCILISTSSVIAIAIVGFLLAVSAPIACGLSLAFGLIYAGIAVLSRRRLLEAGQRIASSHGRALQAAQESLGAIRDVLLSGQQRSHVQAYGQFEARFRTAQAEANTLAQSRRYVVETIGMLLAIGLAYGLAQAAVPSGMIIPILGVFVIATQRLLPVLHQIYVGWATLNGALPALRDVLDAVAVVPAMAPRPGRLEFQESFGLYDASYCHPGRRQPVIDGQTLEIRKGERLGLVGPSGAGKSTLLDLLSGLLVPQSGQRRVDGRVLEAGDLPLWQRKIAYVPQSIFLASSSIRHNIAFGIEPEDIDDERVRRSAELACLHEAISRLPQGYETLCGEGGLRLSGGQRQRLGIARALYQSKEVLMLDEPTSALDSEAEAALVGVLQQLPAGQTVIVVSHRDSTLAFCDRVLHVESGRIVEAADAG